ncbi:MAG TPA: glycosyl transferase family 2, partial [Prolixibacteraceae bacterium]|nr:glycosyl transferase family 2 [Prolixibacteraceae bacterium]
MKQFNLIESEQPLVSICCITYNQEKFIRDAIEGFLMQKTKFPIEVIIHDDASTDKTTDIIREYQSAHPDLIRAIYQSENQFSKGLDQALKHVYGGARGKYIALCEGDDYWTDPLKLQKQVDFMEAHPECTICFHQTLAKYEDE